MCLCIYIQRYIACTVYACIFFGDGTFIKVLRITFSKLDFTGTVCPFSFVGFHVL